MVRDSDDKVPLTQSPSITQETKARFNELINAALTKEGIAELHTLKKVTDATISTKHQQSEGVPKIVPRQRWQKKSPRADKNVRKLDRISSIHSSEESSGSKRVERQVIVEVHSSKTHLLPSSSDDDILSEKKEKKKRKKSRWKQASEITETKEKGQENESFHLEEGLSRRSPSRLSNRSYVVESPTFPAEDIQLMTKTTHRPIPESSSFEKKKSPDESPSRFSNKSYTIEIPSFPVEQTSTEKSILSKIKTPIPLPRRKSLKSNFGEDGIDQGKSCKIEESVNDIVSDNQRNNTIILINDSASHVIDDSQNAGVKLQESASAHTEDDGDIPLSIRKQKRKKKRRKRSKTREEVELQEFSVEADIKDDNFEEKSLRIVKKGSNVNEGNTNSRGEQIVGVTVHGVDCELVEPLVRHPVVRLYVVDSSTGEFYTKSDPDRCVCYCSENTSYIQPIMTHPFDFKHHRSVTPQWDETLLLNENFTHLLKPSTLLLFEVCDFVSASVACARYNRLGSAAVWHVVAWAFLRPVTVSGTHNVSVKLRLQLYKPAKRPKVIRTLTPIVYEWWGTCERQKFPGSLYVTVSALNLPTTPLSPRLRSSLALQAEQGSVASVRSASAAGSDSHSEDNQVPDENKPDVVLWSRLPAQSCKLPNSRFNTLPLPDSSMCVRFSDDGLWLACAHQDIIVYSVPQFQHSATLSGHQGLVYNLDWSSDNKILLSASADCTVCVWRPNHRKSSLLQMLAHPSFVYCAQFVPTPGYCTVVTGCCDSMLRVWQGETHTSYQLTQELSGHSGFVSSVCVTVDGTKVISADSKGSLKIYEIDEDGSLSGGRELRVREVRGITISNLVAHPGGHRLLVHLRDSTVRSVDISTGAVIQTFKGYKNDRVQTGMCVSACGGLVFACGEDGSLVAWDGYTGSLRAVYCELLTPGTATVHYHPHEHMIAVASLAQSPLHILTFQRNASGEDVGLNIIGSNITAADVIEKLKTLQSSNKWQKAASKIGLNVVQRKTGVKENSFINNKNKKKEHEKELAEEQFKSPNWPSLPQLECFLPKSPEEKDLKLLEILRKMDNIILAAKQSSQPE